MTASHATDPVRPAPPTALARVTVRLAGARDGERLSRLAQLDAVAPLSAPVLIGELDGVLVAARSLHDGREAADPFVLTGDVLALLRTRASHRAPRRVARWRGPRMRPAWST